MPLAAPGVLARGMRWMLKSSSPFHVTPRLSPSLARWLWLFRASCEAAGSQSRMPSLRELHVASAALHDELGREHGESWGYQRNGLLEVCETGPGLEGLAVDVASGPPLGVDAQELAPAAVHERFPGLRCDVAGGFFFPEDAHLDPLRFTRAVARLAADAGAEIRTGVEALAIEASSAASRPDPYDPRRHGRRPGRTGRRRLDTGAGRGVSVCVCPSSRRRGTAATWRGPRTSARCPCFSPRRAPCSRRSGDTLRIGSTLELSGWDMSVRPQRVAQLQSVAARAAGPRAAGPLRRVWRGLRPLSPDGLPFVGRCPGHENVIVATGHCMLGLSLGPVTGQLVAELAAGARLSQDLGPLSPVRFS